MVSYFKLLIQAVLAAFDDISQPNTCRNREDKPCVCAILLGPGVAVQWWGQRTDHQMQALLRKKKEKSHNGHTKLISYSCDHSQRTGFCSCGNEGWSWASSYSKIKHQVWAQSFHIPEVRLTVTLHFKSYNFWLKDIRLLT